MEEKGDSKYKRLIQTLLRTVRRVLPAYSGRFSRKTYTQHQHAVAVCLMKYENKPYRDVVDLLYEMRGYFGFEKAVPHFTTLQKFFQRIPTYVWDFILRKTYQLSSAKAANVGIDSTGFEEGHSSSYYEERAFRIMKLHRFMKHTICVDTDRQLVISSLNMDKKGPGNDAPDFIPVVSACKGIVRLRNVTADKGYDSEANHRFVREAAGGVSIIPIRRPVPVWRTTGKYRKMMRRKFPEDKYHQRSKVETVNFVEKRKFGDELRSRLSANRVNEMKVIDVVYNIYRSMKRAYCHFVAGFLQGS